MRIVRLFKDLSLFSSDLLKLFSQFIPTFFNELKSLDLIFKITFDIYLVLNLLFHVSIILSITGSGLSDEPPGITEQASNVS